MAANLDLLGQNLVQPLAGSNPQLRLHQVDAGNRFRHRMLHLNARIHLDKVDRAVLIHQELDRPSILIADLGQAALQRRTQMLADLRRHLQTRRLLDQLLMAPLDRAFALKEHLDIPVLVRQYLKLDMPRPLNEFLHVHLAVAEGICRLLRSRRIQIRQLLSRSHNPHPASAATSLGLQNHRITNLIRPLERVLGIGNNSIRSRQNRHLGLLHRLARFFLLAHQARHLRRRAYELDVRNPADLGEIRILAQQAIAGMDRIHIRNLRRRNHRRHIEIAVARPRRTNADRLIRKPHMQRIAIRLAIDSNRLDAQLFAGTNDAQRNFAAIGNENFTQHGQFKRSESQRGVGRTRRAGRWSPGASQSRREASASISFISFIASTMHTTWPFSMRSPLATKAEEPGEGDS